MRKCKQKKKALRRIFARMKKNLIRARKGKKRSKTISEKDLHQIFNQIKKNDWLWIITKTGKEDLSFPIFYNILKS